MFLVLVGGQLTVNLSAGYLQRGLLVGVGLSSPAVYGYASPDMWVVSPAACTSWAFADSYYGADLPMPV